MSDSIKENVLKIREKISVSAEKSGRRESEIQLVAVSKLQPVEKIILAKQAGIQIFGENRVQDLLTKIPLIDKDLSWHFIGHLQSNKVNKIVGVVEMIQSVDSLHLIKKIHSSALENRAPVKILIQVNTSGEESKFGFEVDEVSSVCELIEKMSNIEVKGLMTIGPLTDNIVEIGKSFSTLRYLSEQLSETASDRIKMDYLSMGMSGDFEIAIEEGSNLVRIGTAIFGPRI